jgi:hypothetical protein
MILRITELDPQTASSYIVLCTQTVTKAHKTK